MVKAWGEVKKALSDNKLTKKEKYESIRELTEAIKEAQQLLQDLNNTNCEE